MSIKEKDKRTFERIVSFMERQDANGEYYSILEDLEMVNIKDLIMEIMDIFRRWKSDLNCTSDPKYKAICNFEFDLIAML